MRRTKLDRAEVLLRVASALLIALALIAGCVMPAPAPRTLQAPADPRTAMHGQVELAAFGRATQATLNEIGLGATVTLYDSTTNQAIASTLTNGAGAFTLSIPGFTPGAAPYVLEAVKGLDSNRAGSNAARLRTIVRYSGGTWSSITTPGIVLGRSSTALCLITSLKSALPTGQQVNPTTLIGKVATGTPDTYTAVANCSQSEYTTVLPLIDVAIGRNRDPLTGVLLDATSGVFRLSGHPAITSTSSLAGLMEGTSVTLTGTGFDPTPANNTVRFNGEAGIVTSASPTQLVVSMRGLTGGTLTVQVGSIVYQGPSYTIAPFAVNDGTTSVSVDNAYQYSPLSVGTGYLYANWTSNPAATSYQLKIGTTPGGSDVLANLSMGATNTYTANGLSLQGAWSSAGYYVTVTPVFATGAGTAVTSNGVQVAEKAFWDGVSTTGLRNDELGGYTANFPAGSGRTQFYGSHYFETVTIANTTTTYVQPFGKQDDIGQAASMNDVRVQRPKDGWLALYANTITVHGTLDAAGRGYGGGPGTSASGSVYCGTGGSGGLSGNGGWGGGQGYGAAGGGGALNALGAAGGRGGYFGGAGGGGADSNSAATGSAGIDATTEGGGAGVNGSYGGCTAGNSVTGGVPPYGGGIGYAFDNAGGTGGAGYGAGAGGAGGSKGLGGGGAGGTGGGLVGGATTGLGWAPGAQAMAHNSLGGQAGRYKAAADTTTDASWILGSGGAGGNAGHDPALTIEYTAGGGGGSGGGALRLEATTLSIGATGKLIAVGAAGGSGGSNNCPGGGGGGGGSGGTIVLTATAFTNQGTVDARGGANGANGSLVVVACAGYPGGNGGNGGASTTNGGTIKVFYRTLTGTMPTTATAGRVYSATF